MNLRVTDTFGFIAKAKSIHGGNYDYSKVIYARSHDKVDILCNNCGNSFSQAPNSHLNGRGCAICNIKVRTINMTRSKDEFVSMSKAVHGNLYSYDSVEYINNYTKVKIYCKEHKGYFYQLPLNHTKGCGCNPCKLRDYGWNKDSFIKSSNKTGEAILYLVKVSSPYGRLGKIGITSRGIEDRFKPNYGELEEIAIFKGDPENIFEAENSIKDLFSSIFLNSESIREKFSGYTECFLYRDDLASDIINIISVELGENLALIKNNLEY